MSAGEYKLCINCRHCVIKGAGENEITEYRCSRMPIYDYVAGNDKLPLCSDMRDQNEVCAEPGYYWEAKVEGKVA